MQNNFLRGQLFLALLLVPGLAGAAVVTVSGQADPAVDRPNLQAAIDGAQPGDTLRLEGTFLFDGERLVLRTAPLTLAGEALDDDGDGAVNEDWADGVDNDGDGAVDEDPWNTLLQGLTLADGSPVLEDGQTAWGNRAVMIEGISGVAAGITIRDLRFSKFSFALTGIPEWDTPTRLCADWTSTAGALSQLKVLRNHFDDNNVGVKIYGALSLSSFRDNLFTSDRRFAALEIEGSVVDDCLQPDGSSPDPPVGTPAGNLVWNNRMAGSNLGVGLQDSRGTWFGQNRIDTRFFGMILTGDSGTVLHGNEIVNPFTGVIALRSRYLTIDRNTFSGAFTALDVSDVSGETMKNVLISRNTVEGADTGVLINSGAHDVTVLNNTFTDTGFVDVFIDDFFEPVPFDNKVVSLGQVTTVIDLGIDTQLIGMIEVVPF